MNDLGSILGVWSHPDDECYLSGGLMATTIDHGHRVVCVTATRGEAADPERWPREVLAPIHERELVESLGILGVTDLRWLDYADGDMSAVDAGEAIPRIAAVITEVRPDTVLTFGPDGQTGHPDHIAISAWTTAAVTRSGVPVQLYYATNTPDWVQRFQQAGERMNVMMGADELPSSALPDCAFNFVVTGELLDRKVAALRAHASQSTVMFDTLGDDTMRELIAEETYRLP